MSDPLRTEPRRAPDAESEPDRDAKIEQLLLAGLDHYFAAEFEQAINVWTRALFLDRSHARARAYIERARSALAERQRESEELLQNGLAAFTRGEPDKARRLLEAAMRKGAPRDEALAVLDRLARLERGTPAASAAPPRSADQPPIASRAGGGLPGRRLRLVLAAGVLAGFALLILATSSRTIRWRSALGLDTAGAPAPAVSSAVDATLPLPLRGEMALLRARALASGGRLHDALAALEAVRETDAERGEADALRSEIQRQLIGLAPIPAAPSRPRTSSGPAR